MYQDDLAADNLILFFILLTGAAEAAQLAGVFLHWSFRRCAAAFSVAALLSAVLLLLPALLRRRGFSRLQSRGTGRTASCRTAGERLLLALFALLAASQILFLLAGRGLFVQGDMAVEAAASFLQTDAVYRVNPMTGRAYTDGLPDRIAILCLPMLYAALSRILHIRPDVLILQAVPICTLLLCYGAYACLARGLFPEERAKRLGFLVMAAFLFWVGSYRYGLDGFGLLFTGWRGTTLRSAVLIPYSISLCLRKKYLYLPLCILAEACIVWTFYGLGACALVTLGLWLAGFPSRAEKASVPPVPCEAQGGRGDGA